MNLKNKLLVTGTLISLGLASACKDKYEIRKVSSPKIEQKADLETVVQEETKQIEKKAVQEKPAEPLPECNTPKHEYVLTGRRAMNIRTGPNLEKDVLARFERYDPFYLCANHPQKGWWVVDFRNYVGWSKVKLNYLITKKEFDNLGEVVFKKGTCIPGSADERAYCDGWGMHRFSLAVEDNPSWKPFKFDHPYLTTPGTYMTNSFESNCRFVVNPGYRTVVKIVNHLYCDVDPAEKMIP
ncbi:MAG: hypothetical protein ABIA37_04045 [Candidatus Woesearchaeota archaeon]